MSLDLPLSARLAWWLTAWLRGHEVTDNVLDAISHGDLAHVVDGLDGGTTLLDLLLEARRSGATGAGLALPVEGDLLGLGGPRALNEAALEVGEAVVIGGVSGAWAVVPGLVGEVVHWRVWGAQPRQVPDVSEADLAMRSTMLEAGALLADLDVARWRPEVADELMNLRHQPTLAAPSGTPARCVGLAARGLQGWAIADLALGDDGGALSAYEIEARRGALQPLQRASRRAIVAACSPEVWPDH